MSRACESDRRILQAQGIYGSIATNRGHEAQFHARFWGGVEMNLLDVLHGRPSG